MIETVGLTKRYGNVVAVDDLSLTVNDGELLVLLGGSGSGKTTTLKMVNRLIEPPPAGSPSTVTTFTHSRSTSSGVASDTSFRESASSRT